MKPDRTVDLWHLAARCALGAGAVALVTAVCFRLHASSMIAALLYLMVVVFVPRTGNVVPSIFVSVTAALSLDYFFMPPVFRFTLDQPRDAVALVTFLTVALVVSGLVSIVLKAHQEQQASREQLRRVIDTIPTLVWSSLPDGSTDFVNQRWLEYTGLSREEARGWGRGIALHPEDRAGFVEAWREAMATGRPFEQEARVRRADGQYRWALIRAVPLRDQLGKIIQWYGKVTDIDDRKWLQESLSEQARLLDLTHDAVFVGDTNDVITYWNRGAEELYGWKREEAIGQVTYTLLKTIFPAALEEITATLLRTGRWEGELVHTTRGGKQITVATRWALERDDHGREIATLETNNDVTDRKQAEEALRKAEKDLAHVGRALTMGELAASIAHEVNQPLAAIVNNGNACLRWLARDSPNLDEAREAALRIVRDGNRASDVITRIRSFLRGEATEKVRLDLNDAIREVVALADREIRKDGVSLRMELARDLPPVLGDRVQLQQVVLNLILNGIEAMSAVKDRPRELVIRTQSSEPDSVCVTVQDSGSGLDAESAKRIFDAFYTTKRGGMGMGLSLSRSIIENHGGRLIAVPNDGPGATFSFTLPKDQ